MKFIGGTVSSVCVCAVCRVRRSLWRHCAGCAVCVVCAITVLMTSEWRSLSNWWVMMWKKHWSLQFYCHTHTHTRLTALCPRLPGWAGTREVQPIWILLKQRDIEWQWHQLDHMQVCTSLQTDYHASTPPLGFLQAGCLSCRPTNSVKALKAYWHIYKCPLLKRGLKFASWLLVSIVTGTVKRFI